MQPLYLLRRRYSEKHEGIWTVRIAAVFIRTVSKEGIVEDCEISLMQDELETHRFLQSAAELRHVRRHAGMAESVRVREQRQEQGQAGSHLRRSALGPARAAMITV